MLSSARERVVYSLSPDGAVIETDQSTGRSETIPLTREPVQAAAMDSERGILFLATPTGIRRYENIQQGERNSQLGKQTHTNTYNHVLDLAKDIKKMVKYQSTRFLKVHKT